MKRSGIVAHALFATSLCAGIALSASVLASVVLPDPVAAELKAMDTSHDGLVSADEYIAAAKARFAEMDADHNGKVTIAEMDASRKARGKNIARVTSTSLIQGMDIDHDGKLSEAEFVRNATARFAMMDENKDGYLSDMEMRVGYDAMVGAREL
jgi:Ca2+-binding EF-hand superfamily protein